MNCDHIYWDGRCMKCREVSLPERLYTWALFLLAALAIAGMLVLMGAPDHAKADNIGAIRGAEFGASMGIQEGK